MTDFTPGAIITRDNPLWDGDRPSWLRDDVRIQVSPGDYWYGKHDTNPVFARDISEEDTAIRLDASDIVYRCIAWNEAHPDEAPWFPWYGGEQGPDDWDGGHVLMLNGDTLATSLDEQPFWDTGLGVVSVVGYRKRRPTTSLPEPAEEVERREPDANRNPYRGMSKCDRCGKLWPSAATGVVHKCECSGGICKPIDGNEFVPAYSAVETAKHYAELAGGVFVPKMAESEAEAWAQKMWLAGDGANIVGYSVAVMRKLGITYPDPAPSPLDLAKAAHPNISPEIVESIFKMREGAK